MNFNIQNGKKKSGIRIQYEIKERFNYFVLRYCKIYSIQLYI